METNTLNGIVNLLTKKEDNKTNKYYYATAVVENGEKFVKIDGSSQLTPVTETVDIQNGDRVVIDIRDHKATVMGNYSYPPSARKEQEALDTAQSANGNAEEANQNATIALEKAQDAHEAADTANTKAQESMNLSEEAKEKANEANIAANAVKENLNTALTESAEAKKQAQTAIDTAQDSLALSNQANSQMDLIKNDIESIQSETAGTLSELNKLASEQEGIKNELSVNVAKKTDLADIEASMSSKVEQTAAGIRAEMNTNYAGKTDLANVESKLQSQITANSESISTTVSKVETIQGETADAITKVDEAITKAQQSQDAANLAKQAAIDAQNAADEAKTNAETSAQKALEATQIADQANATAAAADLKLTEAKTDLDMAKQNLANVTSRVDATETEIAAAQAAVKAAEANVNKALEDANEASLAAEKATANADQAKTDAQAAQTAANEADRKAQDAQLAATNAQNTADQAQKDVAALTNRVTEAETNITQNSEKIALNATKTQEVGDLLMTGYYNKEQTDSMFKVQSDQIQSTVSKTVETELSHMSLNAGCVNMALGTAYPLTNGDSSNFFIGSYKLSTHYMYKDGATYTISFDAKLGEGKTHIKICNSSGLCCLADKVIPDSNGHCSVTFNWISTRSDGVKVDNSTIRLYAYPSSVNAECDITMFKLERGNVSTDWTIALEEDITGGRNLLLDSGNPYENTLYPTAVYYLGNLVPKEGDEVTVSMKCSMSSTKQFFQLYNTDSSHRLCRDLVPDKDGYVRKTFRWTNTNYKNEVLDRATSVRVYCYPNDSSSASIDWIKMEFGCHATTWNPAPEDLENETNDKIQDAINNSATQITEQTESMINQSADTISQVIETLRTATNGNMTSIAELSNQLSITNEMTEFIKTTTEKIQDTVNGKVSVEEIQEWARFNGASLELGVSDSPFKCVLKNTELAFYQDNAKVAWISNNELHTKSVVAENYIQIGKYKIIDEGDLGLSII